MKYVLDVSTALCWVISRPLTAKAVRLRDDYLQAIHDLIAPSIFTAEAASGLTKAERQGLIPVGQAHVRLADILTIPPGLHPYEPLVSRAVDLSSQTRSAFYDCLYVALAEHEGCELVTADQRLINNLSGRYPFVQALAALP